MGDASEQRFLRVMVSIGEVLQGFCVSNREMRSATAHSYWVTAHPSVKNWLKSQIFSVESS